MVSQEEEEEEEKDYTLENYILDYWKNAAIHHLKLAGFRYLDSGSFRRVYSRGNIVIKLPHCIDGYIDNVMEARGWRKYKNKPTEWGARFAPCRLLPDGLLMMVKVDYSNITYSSLPNWAKQMDGAQIGTWKGKLVSYDFALNMTERLKWEKEFGWKKTFFQISSFNGKRYDGD